jgi:hypothetical protein
MDKCRKWGHFKSRKLLGLLWCAKFDCTGCCTGCFSCRICCCLGANAAGTGISAAKAAGTGISAAKAAGTDNSAAKAAGTDNSAAKAAGTDNAAAKAAGTDNSAAKAAGTAATTIPPGGLVSSKQWLADRIQLQSQLLFQDQYPGPKNPVPANCHPYFDRWHAGVSGNAGGDFRARLHADEGFLLKKALPTRG